MAYFYADLLSKENSWSKVTIVIWDVNMSWLTNKESADVK